VDGAETISSCRSVWSTAVGFPFFLRFWFWPFACFRGFSNATFNRSMGSSAGMYLYSVNNPTGEGRTHYLPIREEGQHDTIDPTGEEDRHTRLDILFSGQK